MKNNRFCTQAVILAAIFGLSPTFQSCTEKSNGSAIINPMVSYTPVFKGASTFLEEKESDLTLYSTQYEGIYFIPFFFKGNDGELDFHWNKETNKIEVYESFTGIYDTAGYPIYVLPQNKYEAAMGQNARESFYDPESKSFTFNILLELSDGKGEVVRNPTTATFKVTEVL